jgi:hypothetical protein
MIRIICPRIRHVVQHLLSIQPISFGHRQQPDGSECALSVDIQAFTLAAAHGDGELAGDGEGMTDLRLARAELAEEFSDGSGFDTT